MIIDEDYLYWTANKIVPQNCHTTESIPALYPYALPAYYEATEPLTIMYSGSQGLAEGELFWLAHFRSRHFRNKKQKRVLKFL